MALNLSALLGGGLILKRQLITANGTWTRPAGMVGDTVWLTMIGGGSSGVGSSSPAQGGMGGQYVIRLPVDIGALTSIACTIGLGGASVGGTAGLNNPGGTTSFGALLSVLGGSTPTGQGGANGGSSAANSFTSGQGTPMGSGGVVITTLGGDRAGGGGGLVLDASQTQAGFIANQIVGAKGYGAGGSASGIGTAGAPGAILVEWPEFI